MHDSRASRRHAVPLAERADRPDGPEVFVFDLRGSGEDAELGRRDRINKVLRQTFLRERGEWGWTVDDLVRYDLPAILGSFRPKRPPA